LDIFIDNIIIPETSDEIPYEAPSEIVDTTPPPDEPISQDYPSGPYGASEGSVIEPLEFTSSEGSTISLRNIFNDRSVKLLLIFVSAGWCSVCKQESAALPQIYTKYHSQGLEILAIYREVVNYQDPATVDEAKELEKTVKTKNVPFILAHTYTGHPMMMIARELVKSKEIGEVRKIESWYIQGWLSNKLEDEGQKQAVWRVDPKRSGLSGCGGDIGTHAHMAARWVTGLEVVKVSSRLNTFVKGRQLDDDFNVICELSNGGTAVITATQIAFGYKNYNGFRIYGTKGSIEWNQERAESLTLKNGKVDIVYWLGMGDVPEAVKPYLRVPPGHMEDFFEALANLHQTLEWTIRRKNGEKNIPNPYPHPGVEDGLWGMKFVEASVKSSNANGEWTELK